MVAVAVLVVIAVAGIVLSMLRGRDAPADAPVAAVSTQPTSAPMTAVDPAVAAAEADAGPDQVVFVPGSAVLSEPATTKLVRIAEAQRKDKRELVISATIESRADRAQQTELAKARTSAVRGLLEANQVPLGKMQVVIAEEALGSVTAKDANRVGVKPR